MVSVTGSVSFWYQLLLKYIKLWQREQMPEIYFFKKFISFDCRADTGFHVEP